MFLQDDLDLKVTTLERTGVVNDFTVWEGGGPLI
jgi:hypothetical protein